MFSPSKKYNALRKLAMIFMFVLVSGVSGNAWAQGYQALPTTPSTGLPLDVTTFTTWANTQLKNWMQANTDSVNAVAASNQTARNAHLDGNDRIGKTSDATNWQQPYKHATINANDKYHLSSNSILPQEAAHTQARRAHRQDMAALTASVRRGIVAWGTGSSATNNYVATVKRWCNEGLVNETRYPQLKGLGCNGNGGGNNQNFGDAGFLIGRAYAQAGGGSGSIDADLVNSVKGCPGMTMPTGVSMQNNRLNLGNPQAPGEKCWVANMEKCIAMQGFVLAPSATGTVDAVRAVYKYRRAMAAAAARSGPCVEHVMRHTIVKGGGGATGSNDGFSFIGKAYAQVGGGGGGGLVGQVGQDQAALCKAGGQQGTNTYDASDPNGCGGGGMSLYEDEVQTCEKHSLGGRMGFEAKGGGTSADKLTEEAQNASACAQKADAADRAEELIAMDTNYTELDEGATTSSGATTGQLYVPPKALVSGLSLKDLFGPSSVSLVSQNTR